MSEPTFKLDHHKRRGSRRRWRCVATICVYWEDRDPTCPTWTYRHQVALVGYGPSKETATMRAQECAAAELLKRSTL